MKHSIFHPILIAFLINVTHSFLSHHRHRHQTLLSATSTLTTPRTLYDKIWDDHLVDSSSEISLLYIDRHLVHEVTSPQAFEGLRLAKRKVRRPDCTLATVDHNVPTSDRTYLNDVSSFIQEIASREQVLQLEQNVFDFGVKYFSMADERQGIVHIIGPEQGFTVPGCITVCGDSHTATHGAFGSLAFGIGTSEVEHVLATQTLAQKKSKNMLVQVNGELSNGVTSKDVILHICGVIGTGGGTGYTIEFAGSVIRNLSMEARMSISNMSIEAGARAGLIAADEVTFKYLKGRPMCPSGKLWDQAVNYWSGLVSDEDAHYDKIVTVHAKDIVPTVTWGTSPQDVIPVTATIPIIDVEGRDEGRKNAMKRSLEYIGLREGNPILGTPIDKVFIGSCTNGRIEDIRSVSMVVKGRKVAKGVHAMVVPGSGLVKKQAEQEGLDKILIESGFEWREPGCSMCLAMNPDKLLPQQRCASTSNRNFEGRQGNGGRTHLMSPGMAAASAITGVISDVRDFIPNSYRSMKSNTPSSIDAPNFCGYENISSTSRPKAIINNPKSTSFQNSTSSSPKLTSLTGTAAPLDIQNIDTDMIVPKEFLKTIHKSGLGYAAFAELRYQNPIEVATIGKHVAKDNSNFILNQFGYQGLTKILITGHNFGCGSSREHAPWSINDMGIQCIISSSFADIFYNNCFNNGMLPIILPREKVEILLKDASTPGNQLTVDLVKQTITRPNEEKIPFDIDPFKKHCLLEGLDSIDLTMEKLDEIKEFETIRSKKFPWLDGATEQVPDVIPMYPQAPINKQ